MAQQCSLRNARGRWVLAATMLASSTVFLMGTAVTVALPAIQTYFATGVTSLQWIVNANLLLLSSLLLAGGSLGDQLGRKLVFLPGMAVFSCGAVLSGLATSVPMLIAFQAIQGIGSAFMVPQTLAIINDCFPEDERGQAIGLWAGLSGGVTAFGPWLGGLLVQELSWRAVFFMAVPISAVAFILSAMFIPRGERSATPRIDWQGTLLIFLGLFGVAYAFITGPNGGWNNLPVLLALGVGLACVVLFAFAERRQPQPLLPLRLFRNPLVAGANTVTLFLYSALNAIIFFTVLNLEQLQGYSPTMAGLRLLPPTALITILAGPAGALADRIGPRLQMIVGPLLVALGSAALASAGRQASYIANFLPGLALFGLGMSLVIAPLTKSALWVEQRLSGAASGTNNAVSRVAAVMAIAVVGAIVISAFSTRLAETMSASTLNRTQQAQILTQSNALAGIKIPDSFDQQDRLVAQRAVGNAFAYGFRWAMWVSSGLALAAAVTSFLTIRSPSPITSDRAGRQQPT